MKGCAEKDCNGPTLPNSEYCLMHRKLNKEVVNQERKSNSEQQTSSGGFGLVVLFFISLIILGWLSIILNFVIEEWFGWFGFMFGVIIVTFVFLLKDMDEKTKDN
tara:strand:- start:569 stop:883 length:315 start_codon:yes stop_codon:yes gene_type:complete